MDYVEAIKPYIGYLLSIATFLLGRWWGKRDAYRNERNKAAEPVHINVLSHIEKISQRMNVRIPVTQKQIDILCWHSSTADAEKIRNAWREYKNVESQAGDEYQSTPEFADYDHFVDAARKVADLAGKR
ncbi:TPA: hypothetical protein M1G86_002157 [Salmonella enterica subsp. enterica serovar Wien]|nr:hypothetical protein [Salmonella enterica subsp. enterica serovar Wien]HCB5703881.1 hypothetical protein [Salmonella enterica subsp. enterica serovar Waycross]HCB5710333.1 hypothetical protein [Salmonella enterica subsp. enterica serovar Waycross]HCB5713383.1 hypothetical protein [Salmonella enterica subsp. enterica serovar Waycross]HCB5719631.1 hypothetical protein [Salmonella enterica subsp. enterica serovar Waycross]